MKKIIIASLVCLFSINSYAQSYFTDAKVRSLTTMPLAATTGQTAVAIGKKFIGTPYVAKTLEATPEQLICRTDGLDCYTFVESVIALTELSYAKKHSLDAFHQQITKLRYRHGRIDGYASRIHYFTEWIRQAEDLGILKDITASLGGKKVGKKLNFMSTHPQYYPAMSSNKVKEEIKDMEDAVNQHAYYEIPKSRYNAVASQIKEGDIVVFTTTVAGLDVNHEGFVTIKNGVPHLLHASLDHKKVIVSTEPLGTYLQSIKKHAGIQVLRPN